jgi:hypothetical protein
MIPGVSLDDVSLAKSNVVARSSACQEEVFAENVLWKALIRGISLRM